MRLFGPKLVIGDTKRLIEDSKYYAGFVKMCKKIGLDRHFCLAFLGDNLKTANRDR